MQNGVIGNNVNLSVHAPEVGMLQPEASSQACSLTVAPLLLRTGNYVNSGGKQYAQMHIEQKTSEIGVCTF